MYVCMYVCMMSQMCQHWYGYPCSSGTWLRTLTKWNTKPIQIEFDSPWDHSEEKNTCCQPSCSGIHLARLATCLALLAGDASPRLMDWVFHFVSADMVIPAAVVKWLNGYDIWYWIKRGCVCVQQPFQECHDQHPPRCLQWTSITYRHISSAQSHNCDSCCAAQWPNVNGKIVSCSQT